MLRGLDRFEARSRLKTWIFQILVNTAKTRAVCEKRTIPMSALGNLVAADSFESAVESERFLPTDAPRWPGHWTSLPPGWGAAPGERLLSGEARSLINAAIDSLPPSQRKVVTRVRRGWAHVNIYGKYEFDVEAGVRRAGLRPQRQPSAASA